MDVAQPVVTGVAAAVLELHQPGLDVQLVMGHQDFFRRDLVKARQSGNRPARQVHEGLRLEQPQRVAIDAGAPDLRLKRLVIGQCDLELVGYGIKPPEARVVARCLVLGARISQADKQLDHGQIIGPVMGAIRQRKRPARAGRGQLQPGC